MSYNNLSYISSLHQNQARSEWKNGDANSDIMYYTNRSKVTAVVCLGGQAVLQDELVSAEVLSAVTSVVALAPRAVHQLLL